MDIKNLLLQQKILGNECYIAENELAKFKRDSFGLVSDEVRKTDEYRKASDNFQNAWFKLREFNKKYAKIIHKLKTK